MVLESGLWFGPLKDEWPDPEPSDNGGEDAEFSIGSTWTLQDTDVVEQFIEGMCIIIIGLIDDVSKHTW